MGQISGVTVARSPAHAVSVKVSAQRVPENRTQANLFLSQWDAQALLQAHSGATAGSGIWMAFLSSSTLMSHCSHSWTYQEPLVNLFCPSEAFPHFELPGHTSIILNTSSCWRKTKCTDHLASSLKAREYHSSTSFTMLKFKSWLCGFLAMKPWASYWSSLGLNVQSIKKVKGSKAYKTPENTKHSTWHVASI